MPEEIKYERIDGRDYVFGSTEHGRAIDNAIRRTYGMLQAEYHDKFDANQTEFLARDLVYVSRDVQKVLYDKLRAAEFIPVKGDVPRGAQTWVYRQEDIHGEAEVGNLSTDDAPNADVALEEFPFPTVDVKASYQFTIKDLEYAAFAQRPLQRDKANAAAEIMARRFDQLMRTGNAAVGMTGFLNNPNVPVVTLTNGEWLTATAAEILADMAQVEQAVISQARDNHEATRWLLPTAYEGRIATLAANTVSDLNVREFFLKNSRTSKEFFRWIALDDATGTDVGVSDPPEGIFYDPRPENVCAEIPLPYEELPPQARNFGWVVPCRGIFAGVVFKRPLSAVYLENLD